MVEAMQGTLGSIPDTENQTKKYYNGQKVAPIKRGSGRGQGGFLEPDKNWASSVGRDEHTTNKKGGTGSKRDEIHMSKGVTRELKPGV